MQIGTILDQIDLGAMALPEFQRGYVWNRDQVRELMVSLYRRYPVGSLLIWKTRTENANAKGDGPLQPGFVDLILDGQQRITSLYGVIRGKAPQFYERQRKDYPFFNLYFNVENANFKFYQPLEMKGNPLWVNVTELMQKGIGPFVAQLSAASMNNANLGDFITRLGKVHDIQTIDLHIEQVTGDDKTVDVVVEIFNKVNSGGTKLSSGDLTLAKICASWPEAREEMQRRLEQWAQHGYEFDLDWLLRTMTTVTTGQAFFSALTPPPNSPTPAVGVAQIQEGLQRAEKMSNLLLNTISSRLGLDHNRVLGSRYSFPVMAHYLAQRNGKFRDIHEQNRLLYWYIHTFLWGRYSSSTESAINQDLRAAAEASDPLDGLIGQLRQVRGDLRVRSDDFSGNTVGARFYPMLYMLTRVLRARDWGNGGLELNAHMLGRTNSLQIHHIFPQALLRKHAKRYSRGEINAIANYCFLTQQANLEISDRDPEDYLPAVEAKYPGVLASQWVPMDRELWRLDRYRDFLTARRELLAQAANAFLDSLLADVARVEPVADPALQRAEPPSSIPSGADEEELQQIEECNTWVAAQGLPKGEMLYELTDSAGRQLAIIDLAWPRGLQEGLTQPIALLLNESAEMVQVVYQAGYHYFTSSVELCAYIEREILAVGEAV